MSRTYVIARLVAWYWFCATKLLNTVAGVLGLVALILVLIGVLLFIEQIFNWLRVGTWHPATVLDEFRGYLPSKVRAWIATPDDWVGLWRIVSVVLTWSAWWMYFILALPFGCSALALATASAKRSHRTKFVREEEEEELDGE